MRARTCSCITRSQQHATAILSIWPWYCALGSGASRYSQLPLLDYGQTQPFFREKAQIASEPNKEFCCWVFFLNEVFSFPFVKSRQGQSAARGTNASHGDF